MANKNIIFLSSGHLFVLLTNKYLGNVFEILTFTSFKKENEGQLLPHYLSKNYLHD